MNVFTFVRRSDNESAVTVSPFCKNKIRDKVKRHLTRLRKFLGIPEKSDRIHEIIPVLNN